MSDKDRPTSNDDQEKSSIPFVDTAKKLFAVGLGAAFMTEESIRASLSDLKLPKDVLQFVLNSANKGKEELVQRVGKEIGTLIQHIDLVKEFSRFAENHKFKFTAEIEITPKKPTDLTPSKSVDETKT